MMWPHDPWPTAICALSWLINSAKWPDMSSRNLDWNCLHSWQAAAASLWQNFDGQVNCRGIYEFR